MDAQKRTAPRAVLFVCIAHSQMALRVGADGLERLFTDVVLYLARIRLRRLRVNAQRHQEAGQRLMPVQHTGRDGHAAVRQGDEPVLIHGDVAVLPQPLGGVGHTGLRHAQMLRHVDGADVSVLLLHHQHRLQIVLRGPQYLHEKSPTFPVGSHIG